MALGRGVREASAPGGCGRTALASPASGVPEGGVSDGSSSSFLSPASRPAPGCGDGGAFPALSAPGGASAPCSGTAPAGAVTSRPPPASAGGSGAGAGGAGGAIGAKDTCTSTERTSSAGQRSEGKANGTRYVVVLACCLAIPCHSVLTSVSASILSGAPLTSTVRGVTRTVAVLKPSGALPILGRTSTRLVPAGATGTVTVTFGGSRETPDTGMPRASRASTSAVTVLRSETPVTSILATT